MNGAEYSHQLPDESAPQAMGNLYAAAHETTGWPQFVEAVSRARGWRAVRYLQRDARTTDPIGWFSSDVEFSADVRRRRG